MSTPDDGPVVLIEHMTVCRGAQAVIVVDGSADQVIAGMLAAGWTLQEGTDYVAGKRIRFLSLPGKP